MKTFSPTGTFGMKLWLMLFLLSFAFAIPGSGKTFSGKAGPYDLSFSIRPFPVLVGDHLAKVQLKGPDGKPITGAMVRVQTDMSGMQMGVRPFPLMETRP